MRTDAKDDDVIVAPGSAAGRRHRTHDARRTTVNADDLQLVIGEERDLTSIGREEWQFDTLAAGQQAQGHILHASQIQLVDRPSIRDHSDKRAIVGNHGTQPRTPGRPLWNRHFHRDHRRGS